MPDDYKNDTSIEDEVEKSLQRIIEEETNVAKALVGNQDEKPVINNSAEYGKTQVIPTISKEMLEEPQEEKEDDDEQSLDDILLDDTDDEDEDEELYGVTSDKKKNNKEKKPMPKKTKLIIAGVAAGVAVVIAVIIIVAVSLNKKNTHGYKYYYDEGMKLYENGNYGDAVNMLEKAAKESEGKKNLELKYVLYQAYKNTGNDKQAVSELKDILSYDENYSDAVKALAEYYYDNEDGDNLTKLIRKYQDSKCKDAVAKYIVKDPQPSKDAGSYDDSVEIKLTCDTGDVVYYTTDGSEPDTKSEIFDGKAFKLETGTTKIKAVAVNNIGVMSNVVELEYVIEYGAPEAPDVTPASGKYSKGEKVKINNIPDKCKAYYTTDGKTPTENSTEYTGEFDMPEGNNVLSFIIINEHSQSSTVVKRNYNVEVKNTYTYSQAETQLKNTLIARNVLKSDGSAADGSKVNLVYDTKTTINGTEMYVIRYDVIKNGSTTTAGYYGVDTSTGKIYTVTESNGSYSANAY